ncbi:hypothetical protein C1646_775062 [Rhizophagus diaphanus]|nr:hypothetical protein C1646_775062 [Rhizophagus diaphanus] [Rhizophagus sp. MUCL 43196]
MPPKPAIKPRKKVPYHCDECNGKLVDLKTKVNHEAEYEQMNHSLRSIKISSSSSLTSESQEPIHILIK